MRLSKYINESKDYDMLKKGIQMIYKDCLPFITELIDSGSIDRGMFMYSGRNNTVGIITKNVRKDRKPRNTNPALSKIYDDLFYK